jgi:hypothetical protein
MSGCGRCARTCATSPSRKASVAAPWVTITFQGWALHQEGVSWAMARMRPITASSTASDRKARQLWRLRISASSAPIADLEAAASELEISIPASCGSRRREGAAAPTGPFITTLTRA